MQTKPPPMTPARVVATGKQFGQKIGKAEAKVIAAVLADRPPALKPSYPSKAEAIAAVEIRGFKNSGPAFPQFWTKPSTNTFGAPTLAIVEIVEQIVDPKWGQPNYFTVEFK